MLLPGSDKGLALDNLGRYEEAIKCYDKVIEIEPNHAYAWYYKSLALDQFGENDEAEKCFKKAKEVRSQMNEANS